MGILLLSTFYLPFTPAAHAASPIDGSEWSGQQTPERRLTGTVTGTAGEPLAGVSVAVKGTATGTTTDARGTFTINVPDASAVLVFSSVGFTTQEIPVGSRAVINVSMSASATELNSVVVVGYATQRKRDLTGSIGSVRGEELARQPNTNPIASLQGKVAGLTVANSGLSGASPVVRIRGVNSTNTASPVYVVDGILQDNIDYLNPADIESVDVLKDPSSIAIYGLRAANGVIAVTLRKAARGQTRVTFQSSIGVQKVVNKIALTDAAGFRKLYDAQLANLNAYPFDYTNYTANTNWQDLVFRDAIISNNSLGFSNSTEKSSTLLTVAYNNQQGVLRNDQFQRYLVRLNEEIRVSGAFKVGGDFTGYHFVRNPASAGVINALRAAPIVPVQADEQTYYSMPSFQRAQVGNPVAALRRGDRTSVNKGYRIVGNLYAEVKFLRHFTARSTLYGDFTMNYSRDYTALPFTFINLGGRTSPTNYDSTTVTFDATARTSVSQQQEEGRRLQQDHTLTYDKRFGGGHSITALAGFTTLYITSSSVSGTRRDTSVNVPNNRDFWYIGVINSNNPGSFGGGGSLSSLMGSFARVNYNFKNKYLLNATFRYDGSSKFGPDNRWASSGSIGLGWVVSDEDFFKQLRALNFFKIRGAWGTVKNSNGIADNLWRPGLNNASTAVFGNNVYTAIQAAYVVDPNIKYETVRGLDIGIDAKAFNNRLTAEINFYNRKTSDILTAVTLPNDSRSKFTNLGEITNKGVEVSLGWNDRIGRDFTYSINPNFSYNKNVVVAIGDKINFQLVGNNGANLTETGKSIGYFYGYKQTGIYQSTADIARTPAFTTSLPGDISYADVNGDGVITPADRTYLGTPFPPYNYGISVSVGYKGFDAQIEGQGSAGHKIYTERRTATFAILNYEANRLNAWTGPGTSNIEPILDNSRGNNFLFSSYYLEPGDFFRLRTVQLGYTFGAASFRAVGVKSARLYVSGQNVKTWSRVTGYSPEPLIGSILGGGSDNGQYPIPAVYTFGINVTF